MTEKSAGKGVCRRLRTPGSRSSQRGAAAVEAAVVLPLLSALVVALVWMMSLAVTQLRLVDAARETARAASRSDSERDAVAAGRKVAPGNARFTIEERDREVVVTVVAKVAGPGGVFGFLPLPLAHATATAALEER